MISVEGQTVNGVLDFFGEIGSEEHDVLVVNWSPPILVECEDARTLVNPSRIDTR